MSFSTENLLVLLFLTAVLLAFAFYGKLIAHLWRSGGNVHTQWVGLPDIPMALILGGALGGLAVSGLIQASKQPTEMKPDQLVPGMIFLIVLAGGIAVFLTARRLNLISLCGLRELPLWKAFSRGFVLLWAAVPILLTVSYVTILVLGEETPQQDLVKLFSEVSRAGNLNTVIQIVIAGVVVAPLCEELLFRGYFYPVAKRFLGAGAGAFLTAALFAASHINMASLPSLLILALCFIIAYESTGSLLVPICMHAFFNGANLLVLYLSAQVPR